MKLEKIFFEYLIVGSIALIWLYPILLIFNYDITKSNLDGLYVLISVPFIYVLGMIINFIAENLFRPIRRRMDKKIFEKSVSEKPDYYNLIIELTQRDDRLIDEFYLRSNRVRVTTGTLCNLLFSLFWFFLLAIIKSEWWLFVKVGPFLVLGIIIFLLMTRYYYKKYSQLVLSIEKIKSR